MHAASAELKGQPLVTLALGEASELVARAIGPDEENDVAASSAGGEHDRTIPAGQAIERLKIKGHDGGRRGPSETREELDLSSKGIDEGIRGRGGGRMFGGFAKGFEDAAMLVGGSFAEGGDTAKHLGGRCGPRARPNLDDEALRQRKWRGHRFARNELEALRSAQRARDDIDAASATLSASVGLEGRAKYAPREAFVFEAGGVAELEGREGGDEEGGARSQAELAVPCPQRARIDEGSRTFRFAARA